MYFLASETKGLAGFSPSALACFHKLWCMSCVFAVTLPKTNIELEDGPLEEDVNIYIYMYINIPVGNKHFQMPAVRFRGCMAYCHLHLDMP